MADSRISVNLPAGISELAWKNPVNRHDFKNDPERDNHLFDSHKAYHAKDDVKALRNILHQLKELGGDYGFNPDYKTNPQGKMRCTMNSGRKRKTDKKAFSSRHNDRDFDSNPEHIAKDKSDKNVIWSWCGMEISFDQGELKYYEETFGAPAGIDKSELHQKPPQGTCSNHGRMAKENHACSGRTAYTNWQY